MSEMHGTANQPRQMSELVNEAKSMIAARLLERAEHRTTTVSSAQEGQRASNLLFRLPRELRDIIWTYTLHRSTSIERGHFHVYDKIIDSCTYEGQKFTSDQLDHTSTALLLTSRAVYEDAVQTLYDHARFELVVLAGSPRPYEVPNEYERMTKLSQRNVLGKIGDCAQLLSRIRHATVVIQPGRKPDAKKYEQRLVCFLKALGGGAHLRNLSVHINIGRTRRKETSPEAIETFSRVTSALCTHMVAEPHKPRHTVVVIGLPSNEIPDGFQADPPRLRALMDASKAPRPEQVCNWDAEVSQSQCFKRGVYGARQDRLPWNPWSELDWSVVLPVLPIILPFRLVRSPLMTLDVAVGLLLVPVEKAVRRKMKGQLLISGPPLDRGAKFIGKMFCLKN